MRKEKPPKRLLHSLFRVFERLNRKKVALFEENENAFSSRPCTLSQINEDDGKFAGIRYSPNLIPSDFFLFSDHKRMVAFKEFSADEEVIAETKAYFEAKGKSYHKNGINKLYDRYNCCITLEGNYIE